MTINSINSAQVLTASSAPVNNVTAQQSESEPPASMPEQIVAFQEQELKHPIDWKQIAALSTAFLVFGGTLLGFLGHHNLRASYQALFDKMNPGEKLNLKEIKGDKRWSSAVEDGRIGLTFVQLKDDKNNLLQLPVLTDLQFGNVLNSSPEGAAPYEIPGVLNNEYNGILIDKSRIADPTKFDEGVEAKRLVLPGFDSSFRANESKQVSLPFRPFMFIRAGLATLLGRYDSSLGVNLEKTSAVVSS